MILPSIGLIYYVKSFKDITFYKALMINQYVHLALLVVWLLAFVIQSMKVEAYYTNEYEGTAEIVEGSAMKTCKSSWGFLFYVEFVSYFAFTLYIVVMNYFSFKWSEKKRA